jgi:signal transduction histidine kinase
VLARIVMPVLAGAYAAASVAVALDFDPVAPTTYAAAGSGLALAGLVAGLALIAAGCAVAWDGRAGSLGTVAVLLGAVWLAPDWVGWEAGPALVRSVAMAAAPFFLPLLAHLVLAAPGGRVAGRRQRAALGLLYGAAAAVAVGRALFRDPFLDPHCWSNCTDNVFLVDADPGLADTLGDVWLWASLAGGVALAGLASVRLAAATRPARAAAWPVLAPAALAALALAAYAAALLIEPAEDPERALFGTVHVGGALSLACLAAGLAWTLVRRWRAREAIERLAADLGAAPEPGTLRAALAGSLRDPGLEVAYPLDGAGWVDADGRPVDGRGRATTPIVRQGEPVAVVIHDDALPGAQELERELGAAARVAVHNERLRAEVLAQLEDLRRSRTRIVEAGDTARRRIERDLHDGAQQRLLTLSYELRLARTEADAAGEAELAERLAAGVEEVGLALEELRELAHGIYPAVLTDAGLRPALETLADEAPLPVRIEAAPGERLPDSVERAAYVVVKGAVEAAGRDGAGELVALLARNGDHLVVTVRGVVSEPSVQLVDRVGALGGTVDTDDGTLRAEIPCA